MSEVKFTQITTWMRLYKASIELILLNNKTKESISAIIQ